MNSCAEKDLFELSEYLLYYDHYRGRTALVYVFSQATASQFGHFGGGGGSPEVQVKLTS